MKVSLKRFISLLLVLVMVLAFNASAFATEMTEDEIYDCKITVILSDWTGEYPGDTLNVHFKDVTGTVDQTVELKVGEMVEFVLPAPATYDFTFENLEEGYEVIDLYTYSPAVTSFDAAGFLKDFSWCIEKAESSQPEETTLPSVDISSIMARENVTIVNEEAEKVYLEFLEAVSFMANDESYYDGFGSTFAQCEKGSLNGDLYCKWYVAYVQGGTEEDFFSMSAFERWLWTNTYTRLAYASGGSGNYNKYYGSKASYKTFIVDAAMNLVQGNNRDVVVDAYEKLMDWQWDYINEHGVPFNFIRNRNYIEEINAGDDDVTEPQEPQDDTQEPTEGNQGQDAQGDPIEGNETTEPEAEEDKGKWSATITIQADSSLTFVIFAVLLAAVLVIVFIRKSKKQIE